MENTALLSPSDVHVIRRYVQTKYAPLPADRRAEIVADAIRRSIQRRMPELPAELKERIADELIRRCLVAERREIQPEDVLDVCAGIELADPSDEYRILDPILQWMNERAPGAWSPERVLARLFPNRRILAPGTAGVSPVSFGSEEMEALPGNPPRTKLLSRVPRLAWLLGTAALAGGVIAGTLLGRQEAEVAPLPVPPAPAADFSEPARDVGMPPALRYREIDAEAVRSYLKSRDSMLADEPYFSTIVESGKEFDVNPLLLFAIAGQEQGFVPKSHPDAGKIANNPFNVFHSWEAFNTDIGESADIAARTVARRATARPEGYEPFLWLNGTYAEDPNWGAGVKKIFDKLSRLPSSRVSKLYAGGAPAS